MCVRRRPAVLVTAGAGTTAVLPRSVRERTAWLHRTGCGPVGCARVGRPDRMAFSTGRVPAPVTHHLPRRSERGDHRATRGTDRPGLIRGSPGRTLGDDIDELTDRTSGATARHHLPPRRLARRGGADGLGALRDPRASRSATRPTVTLCHACRPGRHDAIRDAGTSPTAQRTARPGTSIEAERRRPDMSRTTLARAHDHDDSSLDDVARRRPATTTTACDTVVLSATASTPRAARLEPLPDGHRDRPDGVPRRCARSWSLNSYTTR